MIDPVSTSLASGALKIVKLVFPPLITATSTDLAKKFSAKAISTMEVLVKTVWEKLSGKPRIEETKALISKSRKINSEQIQQIAKYLDVAMDEDSEFADRIMSLVKEIKEGRLKDESSITQNIYKEGKGVLVARVEGDRPRIGFFEDESRHDSVESSDN